MPALFLNILCLRLGPILLTFPVCDDKLSDRQNVKEERFILAPGVRQAWLRGARTALWQQERSPGAIQVLTGLQNWAQDWEGISGATSLPPAWLYLQDIPQPCSPGWGPTRCSNT